MKNLKTYLLILGALFSSTIANADPVSHNLVDIKTINPHIQVDLVFASANNFTHQVIYSFNKCYLRKEVAVALSDVQNDLESFGFGIKIYDGFRPLQAQCRLWEIKPDERYVSPPTKGGRHTRGTAVDITLVYKDGTEVPMPTKVSEFNEHTHRDYRHLPPSILDNRNLLEEVMKDHGFVPYANEWWHFDFQGWESADIINIEESELQ